MLGWFCSRVFLGAMQQRLMRRGTAVFNYHKAGPAPAASRDPFLYVSAAELDRQLTALRDGGFRCVSLDDLLTTPQAKAKRFVVTFDDAFQNTLEHTLEILARHRVTAIQFVVAGMMGKLNEWDIRKGDVAERLMNVDQINEWLAAGHEIGSHSLTHPNLKRLSPSELREQTGGSKKKLEDLFGKEIRHFAYPFGGLTPAVRDQVAEAGYRSACSMKFGVNDSLTDHFAWRRIIPHSSTQLVLKAAHRFAQKFSRRA